MKIVAITGSIGCGKTFLAEIIRSLGYVVYDVDKWVKYLYYKKDFLRVIKINFPAAFDETGSFNKRKLRNLVFNDNAALKQLEGIIHPFLKNKLLSIINKQAKNDFTVFIDIALLYEMHWDKYCHKVILADIDKETQKNRVMLRDNIKEDDFDKIIAVQMDNEIKKRYCDVVITTDKTSNVLRAELIKTIEDFNL